MITAYAVRRDGGIQTGGPRSRVHAALRLRACASLPAEGTPSLGCILESDDRVIEGAKKEKSQTSRKHGMLYYSMAASHIEALLE